MQNNRKSVTANAIKLASFSLILLLCIWFAPKDTIPTQNETVINVSDEIFKVQSSVSIENEDINFNNKEDKEQPKKTLFEEIKEFIDQLLF